MYKHAAYAGLSFVDVTTGDLFVTECDYDKAAVLSDLAAYNAREIVCNREFSEDTKFFDEIRRVSVIPRKFCPMNVLTPISQRI